MSQRREALAERDPRGVGSDAGLLRRAWWRTVALTATGMTAVLLLTGGVALVLVNDNQSGALDHELAAVLAQADDVGDPPPGSYLAHVGRDGTVAVTPGTPGLVADLFAAAARPAVGPVDRPTTVGYRVRVSERPDEGQWIIASSLAPLRAEQRAVLQAVLLAEAAGIVGAVVAAAALSRRSVEPLARALELQRRFVADASHELRASLTVLHTRAQVLASDTSVDAASPLGRGLDGLAGDTRMLGEVVEDLLVAAEFGRGPRRAQPVGLDDIAATAVESMSSHARSRGVSLTLAAPDSTAAAPHLTIGNPTALRRAVTALIDNAVGHCESGGHVQVGLAGRGDRVELTVTDDGIGLDPTDTARLFLRSHHGNHGNARRFGLGLAMVREIAHAHGGSVTAIGSPGQGACFTLLLPGGPSRRRSRAVEPGPGQSARIRLLRGSWVSSARPSASSSGGRYMPKRPR